MYDDRKIGSFIAILGLAAAGMTIGWPVGFNSDSVILTTYFFPRITSIGMILCGLWLAVSPEDFKIDIGMVSAIWLAGLSLFVFVVVYIASWDFFLAGMLFGVVSLRISKVGYLRSLLYALCISAAVFSVFHYAFKLQIPDNFVRFVLSA